MTVPVSDRLSQLYVGNGTNTRFDFSFRVFDQEEESGVTVRIKNGTEFNDLDKSFYQVSINQDEIGGFITFKNAPNDQTYFYIVGDTPTDQLLDITNYDNFYPDAIERALDKLTAILQEWRQLLSSEAQSRILADINYDLLAQSRESDLKNYIDAIASTVSGQPVFGLLTKYVDTQIQDAQTQFLLNKKTCTTVENISDLQQLLKWDGRTVFVKEDGRAGLFKYSASSNADINNGTVFPGATNGRWLRIFDGEINVKWFGISPDSTGLNSTGTDYTAKIQALFDWLYSLNYNTRPKIFFPAGIYRTTGTIYIRCAIEINGVNPAQKGMDGVDFGYGTWFYFDHLSKGIVVSQLTNYRYFCGVKIHQMGYVRNNTTPTVGWVPLMSDWDIYTGYSCDDVTLHDLIFYGTRLGIRLDGTMENGAGRLDLRNIKGHFFNYGICIATAFDVVRIDQVHAWPFWRDSKYVHQYTLDNLSVIYFERNDNPMVSNVFTIFANAGLYLAKGPTGTPSKVHLVNADFDRGKHGIIVGQNANATGTFTNISYQCESVNGGFDIELLEGNFLLVEENNTNVKLSLSNVDAAFSAKEVINIKSPTTHVGISNLTINGWAYADKQATVKENYNAFKLASNSVLTLDGHIFLENGNGFFYNNLGTLISPLYMNSSNSSNFYQAQVSAFNGVYTSLVISNTRKRIDDSKVFLHCDINCVTNSSSAANAGVVLITPPYSFIKSSSAGKAVDLNTGKNYSVLCNASTNKIEIRNIDGSNITTSFNITVEVSYLFNIQDVYVT